MAKGMLQVLLVLVSLALFIVPSGNPFAAGKIIKDKGKLTSVEADGTVIIDEKGYEIDPSVKVIDRRGKKTTIYGLFLPTEVYFEYEYTRKGFVIKLIEESPKGLPR